MAVKEKKVKKVKKNIEEEETDDKKLLIFEHELVPNHRIMTEEEVTALMAKYKITRKLLPKISNRDPCAKTLKAKPGEIIEITRASQTAGESKYYRVVVND